jgi:hypothetical protein
MIRSLLFLSCANLGLVGYGQSYAPEPGAIGSTAIHKDSSIFVGWASDVSVSRGYQNLLNPGVGFATFGSELDATGIANGIDVVSLGDRGVAIITFDTPIINGPGADFAIFENGFIDHYMELAFVEVSSDGISFFEFNSVSETPVDQQLTNFSISDCRYINNLAGKYRQDWGTPFDLEELDGEIGLDLNNINFIRLTDVVGSVDSLYGSYDSQGNIINDPFPSEYESGGFDLDAVGVIHHGSTQLNETNFRGKISPNPFSTHINVMVEGYTSYELHNCYGAIEYKGNGVNKIMLETDGLQSGIYFLNLESNLGRKTVRLVKK